MGARLSKLSIAGLLKSKYAQTLAVATGQLVVQCIIQVYSTDYAKLCDSPVLHIRWPLLLYRNLLNCLLNT